MPSPHRLAACVLLATLLSGGLLSASACRTSDAGYDAHPQSKAFDLELAVELTRLNLYVYQHLTDFLDGTAWDPPDGYTLEADLITYEWFSGDTTSIGDDPTPILVALSKDDDLYLLFRGSVTPSEWLDDATFAQRRFDELPGDIWAHDGMSDTYRSVAPEMLDVVKGWVDDHDNATVYITGHSLGAAMGTLGAVQIVEELGVQPVLYTIASPRVGDAAFADAFHERVHTSWRITNINDYVPRAPPSQASVTRADGYEVREYRHVQAVHEIEFGTWVQPPVLESSGLLGLDWDPTTSDDRENIDLGAVDWDSPTLIRNHGSCHYYNYLCDQTDDPEGCKERADGKDGCNAEDELED